VKWKSWLGFAISLFFLYLAFHRVEYGLLFENLTKVNYLYLLPIILVLFANMALRALRWGYFFRPVKHLRFTSLFSGVLIGLMANNVLPARMGEIVRAYVIGRSENISKSASFATIIIERLFDAVTVLSLLLVILLFIELPGGEPYFKHALHAAGYTALLLYAVVFAVLYAIKRKTQWFTRVSAFVLAPFPDVVSRNVSAKTESFKAGLAAVEKIRTLATTSLYSLAIWAVFAYSIYLAGLAFGLHLSVSAALVVLVAICLAMMIPSTPGFIGTYHASVAYALMLYQVPVETAVGFSIIFHAVNYIPITVAGFVSLWQHQLSFRRLRVAGTPQQQELL
jgi:hypothetical protein